MSRRWALRAFAVVFINIVLVGILIAPAYADCIDAYNGVTYCSSFYGCGTGGSQDYFYAQVATQNGSCYWLSYLGGYSTKCPYDEKTQGGKTTLSLEGFPSTYTTQDHAAAWIGSLEISNCVNYSRNLPGCWVQVGWTDGYGATAQGCSAFNYNKQIQTSGAVDVYVEIYDDSANPCFLSSFGQAPTNASYDARYYTTIPGTSPRYRYEVYYQAPGGSIQNLAYGDFASQTTAEAVAGEVLVNRVSGTPSCTVLGQTINNWWNVAGKATSPTTFASSMSLYTGSWQLWTSGVAGSHTAAYIWPPNGQDINGLGNSSNPYVYQPISNFSGGNYTQWKFGGPKN